MPCVPPFSQPVFLSSRRSPSLRSARRSYYSIQHSLVLILRQISPHGILRTSTEVIGGQVSHNSRMASRFGTRPARMCRQRSASHFSSGRLRHSRGLFGHFRRTLPLGVASLRPTRKARSVGPLPLIFPACRSPLFAAALRQASAPRSFASRQNPQALHACRVSLPYFPLSRNSSSIHFLNASRFCGLPKNPCTSSVPAFDPPGSNTVLR